MFNQDVDTLNVERAETLQAMFKDCWEFNGHIGMDIWPNERRYLTTAAEQFRNCRKFNPDTIKLILGAYTVDTVDLSYAFAGCSELNPSTSFQLSTSLDGDDTSHTINASHMFEDCIALNTPLDRALDFVFRVTDLSFFYKGCVNFNQEVDGDDVIPMDIATNVESMFEGCTSLNSEVINMEAPKLTNMKNVYAGCTSFNKPIDWLYSSVVTNIAGMFKDCHAFNQSITPLSTSNVTDMSNVFNGCYEFNQPVDNFDTSNVTDMSHMFDSCHKFNQSVSNFDTSNVTDMSYMFNNCHKFNQSVSGFNTANVSFLIICSTSVTILIGI
jgi:surface protein